MGGVDPVDTDEQDESVFQQQSCENLEDDIKVIWGKSRKRNDTSV